MTELEKLIEALELYNTKGVKTFKLTFYPNNIDVEKLSNELKKYEN